MGKVIVLVKDMFFRVKIEAICKNAEVEPIFVDSPQKIPFAWICLVDLEKFGSDWVKDVKRTYPNLRLVGYYSHVNVDVKKTAQKNGFDTVLPKSEFLEKLPQIL